MNTAILMRLMWKEFRSLGGFWISMAALSLLFLSFPVFDLSGLRDSTDYFYLAPLIVALYATGCGAMLFSSERENRTYWFLRSLPLSGTRILTGKIAYAVVSSVLFFALVSAAGWIIGRFYPPPAIDQFRIWLVCLAASMLGLAWGIFFSLLSRYPLVAALLSVAAASICANGSAMFFGWISLDSYYKAAPLWVVIILLLAISEIALGRRWLAGIRATQLPRPRLRGKTDVDANVPATLPPKSNSTAPATRYRSGFGRLVWQQWRQALPAISALAVAVVPLVLFARGLMFLGDNLYPLIIILAMLTASLVGSCVFLADHRRDGIMFLAQRAARPVYVWLSRQLVWLAVLMPIIVAALIAIAFESSKVNSHIINIGLPDRSRLLYLFSYYSCFTLIYIFVAYASGQLCSLLFRSGILAVVFGLFLTMVLGAWTTVAAIMGMSMFWAVLPIAAGFFLATRLHMGDWMSGRKGWKPRLRSALPAILPAAVIVVIVPFYRAYSIPEIDPGFDVAAFERAESKSVRYSFETTRKSLNLIKSGDKLTTKGQLDGAWENYFSALKIAAAANVDYASSSEARRGELLAYEQLRRWAAAPGQTRERLAAAIRQLHSLDKSYASRRIDAVKREHLASRNTFMGEVDNSYWYEQLPWERKRALRILNVVTNNRLESIGSQIGSSNYMMLEHPGYDWHDRFILQHSPYSYSPYHRYLIPEWVYVQFFNYETLAEIERKATMIALALQAWRLEHDKFPDSLAELVAAFPNEIREPSLNGYKFRLFPHGLPTPLAVWREWGEWSNDGAIPADTPFIWMESPERIGFLAQWMIGMRREPIAGEVDCRDKYTISTGYAFVLSTTSSASKPSKTTD